jgi:hypothetical protein
MTCQLAYRTREGETVYSNPVFGGDCSLRIGKTPANNVVFAIISNTDYKYLGEETRKAHYDYRLRIVEGIKGTADINKQWYDWTKVIVSTSVSESKINNLNLIIYPNPAGKGQSVNILNETRNGESIKVLVSGLSGKVIWSGELKGNSTIPGNIFPSSGLYIVSITTASGRTVQKVIIN